MDTPLTMNAMTMRYGVTARALRFYEERGLMFPKRDGTKRLYYPKDQRRLDLILQGVNLGFSLKEIHGLVGKITDRPDQRRSIVSAMGASAIDDHIALLEARKISIERSLRSIRSAVGVSAA